MIIPTCVFADDEVLRRVSERLEEGPAPALGRPGPGPARNGRSAPGPITWTNLREWWVENVASGHRDVTVLMSEEAVEKAVLGEPPEKVVCLEVGSTFCRPCRAFEPAYKRVAKEYTPKGVRFLRVDGARTGCIPCTKRAHSGAMRCGSQHVSTSCGLPCLGAALILPLLLSGASLGIAFGLQGTRTGRFRTSLETSWCVLCQSASTTLFSPHSSCLRD